MKFVIGFWFVLTALSVSSGIYNWVFGDGGRSMVMGLLSMANTVWCFGQFIDTLKRYWK